MTNIEERTKLCEVQTITSNIICECGRGNMIGTGAVRLVTNGYEHQHRCVFFDAGFDKKGCGALEWFPAKYPLRMEREVPIT